VRAVQILPQSVQSRQLRSKSSCLAFLFLRTISDLSQEGQEGVVNIVVGEISTIARMVLYIYSLDYSDETTTSDNNKLVCNAKLFQAAEFYIIPHLQKLAVTKFETAVSEAYVVDQFLGAIEVIYANPTIDPALRNLVADVCVKQHSTLIAYQGFIDMLSNTPELGKDLTLSFLPAAAKVEQLTKLLLHSKIKNKKV